MPELPIFQRLRADMERIERMNMTCQVSGRLLGRGQQGSPYYVLDGKVYHFRSMTQMDEMDYFEFCNMLRRAERDGTWVMTRAPGFHLGSET